MSRVSADEEIGTATRLAVLWQDGERLYCRTSSESDGERHGRLAVVPSGEYPAHGSVRRLDHEFELRNYLDSDWAVRPLELVRERGRTLLFLEPPNGVSLQRLLGDAMEIGLFLRVAAGMAAALGRMHRSGLIHRDIKPTNVFVEPSTGQCRLTGFGFASPLTRERPAPEPPELITGTLAYMAPEQTGRMNRSVDSRSDLYSFGVVLYQMLTGVRPFSASEPLEWVHCHVARKPAPPCERSNAVPSPLSDLVMKLLAKIPEERYQTAAGVERDLRRFSVEWESQRALSAFSLGEHDRPERLVIPEKLYGRARELETLLRAFDGVAATGVPALVLVTGYSGVGKSSLVNELRKLLLPQRGLFAAAKFDRHKVDVPYASIAHAFQGLVRPLLAKTEAELGPWRDALGEALHPHGALLLDLVPELRLVIGEQPAVVELPAGDAQRRFQLVVRRFIGVFARRERPLALFLDDLQWLDAATLDLLSDWLSADDIRNLLLLGAYRDNEVSDSHPLQRRLGAIQQGTAVVHLVSLGPLANQDLRRLVAETLHADPEKVHDLCALVLDKTGGNPFFAGQFLNSLADEGLLSYEHDAAEWSWERALTLAGAHTDNVVDLMLRRLVRLPTAGQRVLKELACLGDVADIATLSHICDSSKEALESELSEPLRQGLIVRAEARYGFAHDRIREAAYALVPVDARAEIHLAIGRRLLDHTPAESLKEAVFEIVNQLNRGAELITEADERQRLVELNLLAALRSKAATAYAAALAYLHVAAASSTEDTWKRRHELAFSAELELATCEFLTGDLPGAEARLTGLWPRAENASERAAVTCLRIDLYVNLARADAAIAVGLEYLRQLGIDWSAHPSSDEARLEYELVAAGLDGRSIESLIDLPLMMDATYCGVLDVLITLTTPAWLTDPSFLSLVTCRAVNLTLEHGNCDGSAVAYVMLGVLAGPLYADYATGYRFSRLAQKLVDERELTRFQARTYLFFGHLVLPWLKPLREGRELVWRAHDNAHKVGNLNFAAISAQHVNISMLAAGDPLEETQRQIETSLEFSERRGFGLVALTIVPQLGLVRSLRGLTTTFGAFDDGQIEERKLEEILGSNPIFAIAEFFYWVRKLQARFFAGDHEAALAAAARAEKLSWSGTAEFENAEYHFYAALSHARVCDSAARDARASHFAALRGHHAQLSSWANQCPENFADRALLVAAELARLDGRSIDAMRLYDQAISAAQASGFAHGEALANELAGRFYDLQALEKIARLYLRDARHAYLRWGAQGKVRRLDELYPHVREPASPLDASAITAPIDHLDLGTVIKISQALSGEIVLERLLDAVLGAALEHAGAERGILILARQDTCQIEAEANTTPEGIVVTKRQGEPSALELPETVFQYVMRTRTSVLLHDACSEGDFSSDVYIRERRARSVLCLPLLNQSRLIGILYLENNLVTRAFSAPRVAVLGLLASEAATSLENARLYGELQEREQRNHEMRLELAHANRVATVGQLSASIAHEVSQPLAGIITNAATCMRMLAAEPPNLEGGRETLRRAIRDANRAVDVISRLRALFAKTGVALEPLDLNEAIRDVLAVAAFEAQRRGIVPELRLADSLPRVDGDRVQLQQVLLNLVKNALEALTGDGVHPKRVCISTEIQGTDVLVTVEDSGPGVDPASLESLFKAFHSTKRDGLGVGLSICRAIVESHRGTLWVTPASPRGAIFCFTVPTCAKQPPPLGE